jgi:hypothetical protein
VTINRSNVFIAVAVSLLAILSVAMIPQPFHDYVWNYTFKGFTELLPLTAGAAIRVWSFWTIVSAIIALTLQRIDPELELFDALIGGAAGTWIFAYFAGNLLGPIGLFRSWTIWLMTIGAIVCLWRYHSNIRFGSPSVGQKLALLACGLMLVGVLPLQLGSPIPPVMDVLNIPASAQRIVTFGKFLPFDNDPYGYWTPLARVPAVELFYAMLAMGSFTKLAVIAEMAALVPMSFLAILATYRLGHSAMDDVGGGIASILLFANTLLIHIHSMRGTAVAFVLVAVGLAFFNDPRRRPLKTALGALALGTAVASHAIIGGLGIATAGIALVVVLLAGDFIGVLLEAVCLFGALMVAFPEFAIALNLRVPDLLLPISQLIGLATICYAASRLQPRPTKSTMIGRSAIVGLILVLVLLLAWNSPSMVMFHGLRDAFPMLLVLCTAGLVLAVWIERTQRSAIWLIAIALLIGCFADYATSAVWWPFTGTQGEFGRTDISFKLSEYWLPYFLVFPAALVFDWAYHRWSKSLSIVVLLAFVMLPLGPLPSQGIVYTEHPLADEWAWEWLLAKQGWWGATLDNRWAQSPDELALNDVLRAEIRAGRITTDTHIVHVTPNTIMFQDVLLFSLYTGIDDDLYIVQQAPPQDDGTTMGSRLYPLSMLSAALAKRPRYVVVHGPAPPLLSLPLAGYDEIFNRRGLRLFRRHDLSPGQPAQQRLSS